MPTCEPATVDVMEADDLRAQTSADAAAGERLIADRLDSLQAERVIARALELEAEALEQPHMFSGEQLESIAKEINMDVAFVRQALGEIRLTPTERSRLDRFILRDNIMEVETIEDLTRAEVETLINSWMRDYEGLIPGRHLEDGVAWDVDRRLMSRFRASMTAGGNRISRVAGGDVTHRVHSVSDHEHVIAMQSKGEGPLVLAKSGFALAAAILIVGVVVALGAGGLVDFAQTLAGVLVGATAVAGGALVSARRWARGIGRALRRSLTGLASRAKPKPRTNFRFPWRRR